MANVKVKKAKKAVAKSAKKVVKKATSKVKKVATKAKKVTRKAKGQASGLMGNFKKRLNTLKDQSSKALHNAKDKAYDVEEEIMDYVKKNPIKTLSAAALTGLIAGFVARLKK